MPVFFGVVTWHSDEETRIHSVHTTAAGAKRAAHGIKKAKVLAVRPDTGSAAVTEISKGEGDAPDHYVGKTVYALVEEFSKDGTHGVVHDASMSLDTVVASWKATQGSADKGGYHIRGYTVRGPLHGLPFYRRVDMGKHMLRSRAPVKGAREAYIGGKINDPAGGDGDLKKVKEHKDEKVYRGRKLWVVATSVFDTAEAAHLAARARGNIPVYETVIDSGVPYHTRDAGAAVAAMNYNLAERQAEQTGMALGAALRKEGLKKGLTAGGAHAPAAGSTLKRKRRGSGAAGASAAATIRRRRKSAK